MAKTFEERIAELEKQRKPVKLPRYEFIKGVGVKRDSTQEQGASILLEYFASDVQSYQIELSPAEAFRLARALTSLLHDIHTWDMGEKLDVVKEYLRENYQIEFPY